MSVTFRLPILLERAEGGAKKIPPSKREMTGLNKPTNQLL